MPVRRPSSSTSSAATSRPSSRAIATRSVRYSSPVAGDGFRSPIRRRSQAASSAYRPALISVSWRSSSLASLSSTIRSTVPPSLRTTRPRPVGSSASTATSEIAAWSMARASSRAASRSARTSGTSPETHEDLLRLIRQRRERRAEGVAGPERLVLERRVGPLRDGVAHGLGGGRVDDDRRERRWPPRRHRARTPPSRGRTAGGGPWACATSSACRDRPRGRRRRSGALGRPDLRGSQGGAPGESRGQRRRWCGGGGARGGKWRCHVRRADSGVDPRRVSTRSVRAPDRACGRAPCRPSDGAVAHHSAPELEGSPGGAIGRPDVRTPVPGPGARPAAAVPAPRAPTDGSRTTCSQRSTLYAPISLWVPVLAHSSSVRHSRIVSVEARAAAAASSEVAIGRSVEWRRSVNVRSSYPTIDRLVLGDQAPQPDGGVELAVGEVVGDLAHAPLARDRVGVELGAATSATAASNSAAPSR